MIIATKALLNRDIILAIRRGKYANKRVAKVVLVEVGELVADGDMIGR